MPLPEDPTALLREGVERVPRVPRAGGRRRRRRCVCDARQPVRDAVLVVLLATRRPASRTSDPRSAAAPGARTRTTDDETRDLVIASVGAGLLVAAMQGLVAWRHLLGRWVSTGPSFGPLRPRSARSCRSSARRSSGFPTALWLLFRRSRPRDHPRDRCRARRRHGRQRAAAGPSSGRTSASGLVVFLGLLGGASAFGFIGLVLGPIILVTAGSLLTTVTRSRRAILSSQRNTASQRNGPVTERRGDAACARGGGTGAGRRRGTGRRRRPCRRPRRRAGFNKPNLGDRSDCACRDRCATRARARSATIV